MKVLIDIGDSGVRIATCQNGRISDVCVYGEGEITDLPCLIDEIRKNAADSIITGIAVSVPGFCVILRSLDVTHAVSTDFQIKEKPRNCLISKQLRGFCQSGKRGIRRLYKIRNSSNQRVFENDV